MKYFKQYKGEEEINVITKEQARKTLSGHWDEEMLNDIFDNEKAFRLFTPFSEVWTMTDDGLIPMAGFYGFTE